MITPPAPQRRHEPDASTIAEIQRNLDNILRQLDDNAESYAAARQCQEFIGDRKKTALGEAFQAVLATDPEASASSAEHRARASTLYKERMKELMREHLTAENAITLYELLKTRLDVGRSLLAIERAKLENRL